jgi:hypothetical protein
MQRGKKKTFIAIVFFIAVSGSSMLALAQDDKYRMNPTPDPNAKNKVYVPKDLEEAFKELKKMLHPDLIKEIKEGKEEDMVSHHMGLGRWLRNNWALWGGGRLAKHFNSLGIYHPDDMSGIILDAFWCHLNGKPLRLEERIAYYKEYWRLSAEPKNKRCPQDGSVFDISQSINDVTKDGKQRIIHIGYCKRNKHLWVYEADKGWYKPDADLKKRIE